MLVLAILNVPIRLFNWASEYSGPIVFVKAIPVLMMCAVVFFPYYTFPLWLGLGLSLGVPLCYVVYVLWWLMVFVCIVGSAIIGYLRLS
jgi:hypothetical protein